MYFYNIETNCYMAMKAVLLINSLWIAFYLVKFDVQYICKVELNKRLFHGGWVGGLHLPAHSRERQSFRKILTAGQWHKCLCMRVCLHKLMWKQKKRVNCGCKGHSPCKRDNKNFILHSTSLPNAPLSHLCVLICCWYSVLRDREGTLEILLGYGSPFFQQLWVELSYLLSLSCCIYLQELLTFLLFLQLELFEQNWKLWLFCSAEVHFSFVPVWFRCSCFINEVYRINVGDN